MLANDFFRPKQGPDPTRVAEVKRWVAEAFRLPPDVTVLVTELRCTEPGCPPLETVIAILGDAGAPRQHKFHKGLADLTCEDVALAAGA